MNGIICRLIPLVLAGCLSAACGSSGGVTTDTKTASQEEGIGVPMTSSATTTGTQASFAKAMSVGSEAEIVAHQVDPEGAVWDISNATRIELKGDTITVTGNGAAVDGSTVTIKKAGEFEAKGVLSDGQIVVDTGDKETVKLILNGVEISNSKGPAINISKAKEAAIILAYGSSNKVSDTSSYVLKSAEVNEPNAAVFSKADLTISGGGSLAVKANYNDGIASKDGLAIIGGTLTVDAIDDGIRGKDYLVVKTGTLTIKAGGDGLKSDNGEDADLGYISIENGTVNINAGSDAIDAQTEVRILGGNLILTSGGGSYGRIGVTRSAKAVKGTAGVYIDGGTFTIDAADDGIHSNEKIIINDGAFAIATSDDGIHSDKYLEINCGKIDITESFEGMESSAITINGGRLHIAAGDDGINIAGIGMGRWGGGRSRPGQNIFNADESSMKLTINGGYVYVNANGDGIDIGGPIVMTGGLVIVNGPTQRMNSALDHAGFTISGGTIVAVGSAGMAQTADQSSTQNALLINLNSTLRAGMLINISNSDRQNILTFAPAKDIQSIAFSSPELKSGMTYEVSYGGVSTGKETDGLYQGGIYSGGQSYAPFTVSSTVTLIGDRGRFDPRRGFGRRW